MDDPRVTASEPRDLDAGDGTGPLWGIATDDLNVTLLAWPPGHAVAGHVNDERDVLLVVVEDGASVAVDDAASKLAAPAALVIPKDARRSISAGPQGVRYLSGHTYADPVSRFAPNTCL